MPQSVKIFFSFAGEDRPHARQLAVDLAPYGVHSFIDSTSIEPGANIVEVIGRNLDQSDYFVLLWSKNTVNRSWVTAEWSVALLRSLNERRSLLYVVRLDDTPTPVILAPYKYLDAFEDWGTAVAALAKAWHVDRSMVFPVLPTPQPEPRPRPSGSGTATLLVRNNYLSVVHKLRDVSTAETGPALLDLIAWELQLPERVPELDRILDTRLRYELELAGRPLTDQPLAEQGIVADSTIDLLIQVDLLSRGNTLSTWTLRTEPPAVGPDMLTEYQVRAILDRAFRHLKPW